MNGRLAVNDLTAQTLTAVYQAPSTYTVATVAIVNRNHTPAKIRVAVSATQTPAPEEYIEYDTELPGKGHIERTGVAVQLSNYVVVESDVANVNCVIWGTEVGT